MNQSSKLSVVLPVYNEAENIADLIQRWTTFLDKSEVIFDFFIVNDGSTDGSLAVLEKLAKSDNRVIVHSQHNKGHGPAIRYGYELAAESDWIFQLDSDSSHDTSAFETMWHLKDGYDFLTGEPVRKNASAGRHIISWMSVVVVRFVCGKSVKGVNMPYRLMRGEQLKKILLLIPSDSFAVNIMITMYYLKYNMRIFSVPVKYLPGSFARKSKTNPYFIKGAFVSFFQIIQFGMRL